MLTLSLVTVLAKILKILMALTVTTVIAAIAFLWWARGGEDARDTAPWRMSAPERFDAPSAPAPATAPQRVTVLTWNMAYGRGPKDDAGDLRSEAELRANLEQMAKAIVASGADVVALQEVDFDAHRTHRIDELRFLAERAGYPFGARVTTWKNRYVPYPYWPPSQHYGAMDSGQAVLSRYPIVRNARLRYPQPATNPFFYNWFYLHRATQVVDVQLADDRMLRVLNTHQEAFDVPNRRQQAERLLRLLAEEHTDALVLLGDFNAVPPEATRKRGFADEPEADFTDDDTIATLRAKSGLAELIPADVYSKDEQAALTFPADAPTRRLDYLFFGAGLVPEEGGVWHAAGALSDHLPLRAVLHLRGIATQRGDSER